MVSKSELAQQYSISPGTLQNMLNRELFEELEKVGYKKEQRLLSPAVIRKIHELIGKPLKEDEL